MHSAMNFLTTPTQSPRGNEALATPTGPDGGHSGAAFAGVLNGQMLKLERQALATSPAAADDLQVLRLGNKLNVITTDAPLPDIASLAQFARAQGLGETAVQALFGSAASLVAGPTPSEPGITVGINGASLTSALGEDSAAQAAALAQAAVKALIAGATSQTSIGLQASEANSEIGIQARVTDTGLNMLIPNAAEESNIALAGQKNAYMRTPPLEDTLKIGNIAANTQILNPASVEVLTDKNESKTALTGTQVGKSGTSLLEAFLAERALLGTVQIQASTPSDKGPAKTQNAPQSATDLVLAAAVQVGLGMVPQALPSNDVTGEEPLVGTDQAVSIRYLSIQNGGVAPAALAMSSGRTESLTQIGQAEVSLQTNSVPAAETQAVTQATDAGDEAQAALQLRLVPPDQAITKRLALIAGTEKPIDWSALLAGQKVSDTLSGLAQSPAPVLSDAQAKLIAQMQANGQLPHSADEARNALLAKVQAQAAKMGTFGVPSVTAPAAVPMPVASIAPKATAMTQGALLADLRDSKLLQVGNPAQTAVATLAPPPGPAQGQTHSLWETVRIEVPSGLALEALQASKNQRSDAEPELPMGPGTAQANGPAVAPAAAKPEAATPQALAEQRAAQYQQIADQMGEAMARRLMAQIERGQWKMQLRMQPSALGRIEVELNMHKSGLDATFSADNAVTRELMAQGSARLRDTLTQSGTTVASVVVNGDSGRQSGGNSTPGQKSKDEQSANSKKSAAATVANVATKAPVDQGDGLNLLA